MIVIFQMIQSEVLYKYDIDSGKWKLNQSWTSFGSSIGTEKIHHLLKMDGK